MRAEAVMLKRTNRVAWGMGVVLAGGLVVGAALSVFQVGRYYLRQRALVDAVNRGDVAAVLALLDDGVSVKARDRKLSAFECAMQFGETDVVNAFLAHGASAKERGPSGETPLEWAAGCHQRAIVNLLLIHGADPNEFALIPPLASAAQDGPEMVRTLLAHGADPNPRGENIGSTPLAMAAQYGRIEVMRILIAHGANVDARNMAGVPPLMEAAVGRKPEIVKLLLAHGADVNVKQYGTSGALSLALDSLRTDRTEGRLDEASKDTAIIRLLKQAGAKE
jgi:ankyrin repeat protein